MNNTRMLAIIINSSATIVIKVHVKCKVMNLKSYCTEHGKQNGVFKKRNACQIAQTIQLALFFCRKKLTFFFYCF